MNGLYILRDIDWESAPGHSHNDALRILSKRILRDLWRAARNHHEGTDR